MTDGQTGRLWLRVHAGRQDGGQDAKVRNANCQAQDVEEEGQVGSRVGRRTGGGPQGLAGPGGRLPAGLPQEGEWMEKSDFDRIVATVRRIAVERLKPVAAEVDRNCAFPRAGVAALADSGFHGLIVSGDHGGMSAGRGLFASVVAEIAAACASSALVYVTSAVVAKAIDLAATRAATSRWLPGMMDGRLLGAFAIHEPDSGSDASAITTRATRSGDRWTLRGSKFLTTAAGEADLYLVLARSGVYSATPKPRASS